MKISMSMLTWYLKPYEPIPVIMNDERMIQGMRLLPNDNLDSHQEYVYFGKASYFLSDLKYKDAHIVVYKQSYLLFKKFDYEELLNAMLSSFEYFADWSERILQAASIHLSLQKILDIGAEVIGNPFIVGDMNGTIYSSSASVNISVDPCWDFGVQTKNIHPNVTNNPFYDSNSGKIIKNLSETPQLVRNIYPGSPPVLMMHLIQNQEAIAWIGILQMNRKLTVMNQQLAPLIAQCLLKSAEFASPSATVKSSELILNEILDGKMQDSMAIRHLENRGLNKPWRLLLFSHITRNDQIQKSALLSTLQKSSKVYIPFSYHNQVLAIISDEVCYHFREYFESSLNFATLRIGVSMVSADWKSLPICYQQAKFALEQGDRGCGIYHCEDYAFAYLIQTLREQKMTFSILHPALDTLSAYDLQNKGELRKTLSVYLQKEMNLIETADALNIHRNTLKYRLSRIKELTNLTLKQEEELRYLRLSDWLSK